MPKIHIVEWGFCRSIGNLKIRKGSASTSVSVVRVVPSNTLLGYVSYVVDGENVSGVSKWFKDHEGNYFWSGAVDPVLNFDANPLKTKTLTQGFGSDKALYSRWGLLGHHGLDFKTKSSDNPLGKRDVFAVWPGVVLQASYNDNNGNFVRLQHAGSAETVYLHLHSYTISAGAKVPGGQKIGISNNTGFSSAPHLHFGLRPPGYNISNGFKGYVDPEPYLL